jgi:hypothetical protein
LWCLWWWMWWILHHPTDVVMSLVKLSPSPQGTEPAVGRLPLVLLCQFLFSCIGDNPCIAGHSNSGIRTAPHDPSLVKSLLAPCWCFRSRHNEMRYVTSMHKYNCMFKRTSSTLPLTDKLLKTENHSFLVYRPCMMLWLGRLCVFGYFSIHRKCSEKRVAKTTTTR